MKVPLPLDVIQSGGIQDTATLHRGDSRTFTAGGDTVTTSALLVNNEEIKPVNNCVVESRSLTTLQPPPLLAKPPEYHPLHIFVSGFCLP